MSIITVGIYRVWGDELIPPILNDNEVALMLHNNRKEALHEIFDNEPSLSISNWGDANSVEPHEFVEIIINTLQNAPITEQIGHFTTLVIDKLLDLGLDNALSGVVTWLIMKFKKKQDKKKISWVKLQLQNGILIELTNPHIEQKIKLFKDGKYLSEFEVKS